jgi:hypothetical protein
LRLDAFGDGDLGRGLWPLRDGIGVHDNGRALFVGEVFPGVPDDADAPRFRRGDLFFQNKGLEVGAGCRELLDQLLDEVCVPRR